MLRQCCFKGTWNSWTNSKKLFDFFINQNLLKFAFVTGISYTIYTILATDFDLTDITGNLHLHGIAGIDDSDLENHHKEHIAQVSGRRGKREENVTGELQEWYNGYNFSDIGPSSLHNPLSVHNYFESKGAAKGYWADKGPAAF